VSNARRRRRGGSENLLGAKIDRDFDLDFDGGVSGDSVPPVLPVV
jgi:hypothetical protein